MDVIEGQNISQEQLAQINIEITKGRATLASLKETLGAFLTERSELEKGVIKQVYEESKGLLDKIDANYLKVQVYYNEIRSYTTYLEETQDKLIKLLADFHESSEGFVKYSTLESDRLANMRNNLIEKENIIKNDEVNIGEQRKDIDKQIIILNDKQTTIAQNYQALKRLQEVKPTKKTK